MLLVYCPVVKHAKYVISTIALKSLCYQLITSNQMSWKVVCLDGLFLTAEVQDISCYLQIHTIEVLCGGFTSIVLYFLTIIYLACFKMSTLGD